MKKNFFLFNLCIFIISLVLTSCSINLDNYETNVIEYKDSSGRIVNIPKDITRVAPSGVVANMILSTMAPEYMVTIASEFPEEQIKYLPKELETKPITGQIYGSKASFNIETLLTANPQVIIDLGDAKNTIASDLDDLQNRINIPVIFIDASLKNIPSAYMSLGEILYNKSDIAEKLANFADDTINFAQEKASQIPENKRVNIMYTTGKDGMNSNAMGSVQAQVLEFIGAKNAIKVDNVSNKGGGNIVNMEQIYNFNPYMILFAKNSIYDQVSKDISWQKLSAIQGNRYYEVPNEPYNWISDPPGINMLLGIWWLGKLVYPDYYNIDINYKIKEFYSLFWKYDISEEEIMNLLDKSLLK